MKDKAFLDTNIFVYSVDSSPGQGKKREIARELVRQHLQEASGVISIQVLQEFYQVSTHKIRTPLPTETALEYLHYISVLETVHVDFGLILRAIDLHQKHKISFWDALIVEAARTAGCSNLFSEDLQDGFHIGNMTVKNPF